MPAKQISVTIQEDILAQLDERGDNRSYIIRRDLERLYTLYRIALRQIRLSLEEAMLIVDALNGTLSTADQARLLWAGIEDAIAYDKLDEKWNVNGKELVEKLKNLNELQAMAIIDAAERFWAQDKYREKDMKIGVAECFGITTT